MLSFWHGSFIGPQIPPEFWGISALCQKVWILRNPAETKYGTLESEHFFTLAGFFKGPTTSNDHHHSRLSRYPS
jgi:hypothetical protein